MEKLIDIAGTLTRNRVKNITFQGITFTNTDYNLVDVGGSHGKSTCQGTQAFIAFYNDEGTAYINENDNVLDIDKGVKYTINCEDFG